MYWSSAEIRMYWSGANTGSVLLFSYMTEHVPCSLERATNKALASREWVLETIPTWPWETPSGSQTSSRTARNNNINHMMRTPFGYNWWTVDIPQVYHWFNIDKAFIKHAKTIQTPCFSNNKNRAAVPVLPHGRGLNLETGPIGEGIENPSARHVINTIAMSYSYRHIVLPAIYRYINIFALYH